MLAEGEVPADESSDSSTEGDASPLES
jgi:hypothetical protein